VTDADVRAVQDRLNGRPRKVLGYRTSAEIFYRAQPPWSCSPLWAQAMGFSARARWCFGRATPSLRPGGRTKSFMGLWEAL